VTFRKKLVVKLRSCWPLAQHPSWRTNPCRLSATAYSVYLHRYCISGSRLLHPQPEDALCHGDRDPHNMGRVGAVSVNVAVALLMFLALNLEK
jgi:hypothetical protein